MARNKRQGQRVHIIARDKKWAVKKEGLSKASKIHRTKDAAINDAKRFKKQGHDIIVHKKDGTIERWEKGKK